MKVTKRKVFSETQEMWTVKIGAGKNSVTREFLIQQEAEEFLRIAKKINKEYEK